jgi:hypothetical protein
MNLTIDSSMRSSLDAALYSPRKGHNGALSRLRANRNAMVTTANITGIKT